MTLEAPTAHQNLIRKFAEGLLLASHQDRDLPTADEVFGWASGLLPAPTAQDVASRSELPHHGDCMVTHRDVPRWQVVIEFHPAAYAVEIPETPGILQVYTRSNTGSKTNWWKLRKIGMAELLRRRGRIDQYGSDAPEPEPANQSDLCNVITQFGGDEAAARDALWARRREAPKATGEYAEYFDLVSAVGLEAAEECANELEAAGTPVARPNPNVPDNRGFN